MTTRMGRVPISDVRHGRTMCIWPFWPSLGPRV